MTALANWIAAPQRDLPGDPDQARQLATELGDLADLNVYPRSVASGGGGLFFLGRRNGHKRLCILSAVQAAGFHGEQRRVEAGGTRFELAVCDLGHDNARALRSALPFTAPGLLGLKKTIGLGDRLGLATPGHIRSVRRYGMVPVLAQQSVREMDRTGRTPTEVLDDATWGVFQEGFRDGFGADADHLKTVKDIDRCVEAGFTFFTIDPSEHVDEANGNLEGRLQVLPWDALDASLAKLKDLYLGRRFDLDGFDLELDEPSLLRAAVKYGRAVAHAATMFRYLESRMTGRPFELEMSVDETESSTSVKEHFFVASELKRLEVDWVSLAPRYVGRFEKGIDYIGDVPEFGKEFSRHVAVARALGPYKLGIHSGSDKFAIYPVIAEQAANLVHLKTAGTSYLEALRVIADLDPRLFGEIVDFALSRYPEERASYQVSADPAKVNPEGGARLLERHDARQVLHVTFGSVLRARTDEGESRFRSRMLSLLRENEEAYYIALEKHVGRHLRPFDG